jgi:hypothetical protein
MADEPLAYLSHSIGFGNGAETVRRYDNIANAGEWLVFLVDHTGWMVVMPWHTNAVFLRELHRPRAMADQLRVVKRCDVLVLCGGAISPHMQHEIRQARRNQVAIVDLTDLGWKPPLNHPNPGGMLDKRLDAAVKLAGRK